MSILAIDWDNTLSTHDGKPLPGAKEALGTLRAAGHSIIIHSCNRAKWIEQCLNEWGIPVDSIWDRVGKPVADLYIDDHGYEFKGDWSTTLPEILGKV